MVKVKVEFSLWNYEWETMFYKISNTFLGAIYNISRNCENPEWVDSTMRHVMIKTVTKCKMICMTDLYNLLLRNKLATTEVNQVCAKLCNKLPVSKKQSLTNTVMKWKLEDTRNTTKIMIKEEKSAWRECKKYLDIRAQQTYNQKWAEEKYLAMKTFRAHKEDKFKWLKKKYQLEKEVPDTLNDVFIADQELDASFNSNPKCYGGIIINDAERGVLSLQPKFTLFDKVQATQCEAEIEKSLTSIRLGRMRIPEQSNNEQLNIPLFNLQSKTFDWRNVRSTILPFNAMVHIPKPLPQMQEIPLQNLKQELLCITHKYCQDNNNITYSNLSKEQQTGLNTLIEKIKDKECVVFPTDKSNNFSIDSVDNYIRSTKPHIEKDIVVTTTEFKRLESLFNAHATFWINFLQIGKEMGDQARFKRSMMSHNSAPAKEYSFRKDHKEVLNAAEPDNGPPVRPLCDISDANNHRLSYLICMILRELTNDYETQCESTEDMLATIQKVNREGKIDCKTVLGSLDVKSLYPSLDIPFTIGVVCDQFERSGIEFAGIDYEELGLYLSISRNKTYLDSIGIIEYCPTRPEGVGRPPTITASGSQSDKAARFALWKPANRQVEGNIKNTMVKEALRIILEVILQNHTYIFNNVIRKQTSGGPIGMDLTGLVAKIFMAWWDTQMIRKSEEIGITIGMYKRYVDDINISVQRVELGARLIEGRIVIVEDHIETDQEIEEDQRTFTIIKQIGESIHKSILLETDYPSKHADDKLPILDLKVWVHRDETSGSYSIIHEHYIKDVSTRFLTHAQSAVSWKDKRTIITQMGLRVLLNCSPQLPKQRVTEHLTYFSKRMQASGYDKRFRYEVIKSVINGYDNIKELEDQGRRPMYRERGYDRTERRKTKERTRAGWFKRNNHEAVLFVPSTPGSQLASQYRQTIEKHQVRIRVVERAGKKMKNILQRNDPLSDKHCKDDACFVCTTNQKNKGNCRTSGITYAIKCASEQCMFVYNGQSGKNAFSRGKEHIEDYHQQRNATTMWSHCIEQHEGIRPTFSMEVVETCRNDAMKRQILEAIHINETDPSISMNSRTEWNFVQLPRLNVTT